MKFSRILTADIPGELLAAQIATTGRTPEDPTAALPEQPSTYGDLFATLAALADNPGVLTADTPGQAGPARPEGELQ